MPLHSQRVIIVWTSVYYSLCWNGILMVRKVHQVFHDIKSISCSPFSTPFFYSYYGCFYTSLRLLISISIATHSCSSVCLLLNPSPSFPNMFPPCNELQKARNLSAIFDSSFFSAWHIQTTAKSSQLNPSNPVFCLFTPHSHFLTHHFLPGLPGHLTFTHVCTYESGEHFSCPQTHTQKSKLMVKVVRGTVENFLAGTFPGPAFSINHV